MTPLGTSISSPMILYFKKFMNAHNNLFPQQFIGVNKGNPGMYKDNSKKIKKFSYSPKNSLSKKKKIP